MAAITAAKISQNAGNQKTKAEQLHSLAKNIKTEMDSIDKAIYNLVSAGIQGSAVQQAASTYIKNRETISGFVQRFAATAVLLDSAADAMDKLNTKAGENATAK